MLAATNLIRAIARTATARRPRPDVSHGSETRHVDAPPRRRGGHDGLDHRLHARAVVERRDARPPLANRGHELCVLVPSEGLLWIDASRRWTALK